MIIIESTKSCKLDKLSCKKQVNREIFVSNKHMSLNICNMLNMYMYTCLLKCRNIYIYALHSEFVP